jgi:hypothetical protein
MNTEQAPISIEETRRTIAALQAEQFALYPLGDIPALEHRLAIVGAQAQVKPSLRGELEAVSNALDAAVAAHARNAAINTEINHLTIQLNIAEAEARQRLIEEANSRILSLKDEFNLTAKEMCRKWEQLHRTIRHYEHSVPGYRALRLPEFDMPFMLPTGWTGSTTDLIRQGSLPWLNKEKEQAA